MDDASWVVSECLGSQRVPIAGQERTIVAATASDGIRMQVDSVHAGTTDEQVPT
jgi:hypothetical protein